MMDIELNWIVYLLLASNAALAAAASLAILRAQRMSAKQKAFWESPTGASLGMQLDGQHLLDAIDRRLKTVSDQIREPESSTTIPQADSATLPYENAVRMARHGATIDDLTRTCGLSASEARLLMRVHGNAPQLVQTG